MNNEFRIHIQFPKKYCNYNCSYCFQEKHQNPSEQQKRNVEKVMKLIFSTLNKLIENSKYEYVTIVLLGGEVVLYDLNLLFSLLTTKKKISIEIKTNFSKQISYYKNILEKNKNINFYITISLHNEYLSYKNYKHKLLKLKKEKTNNLKEIKTNFVISNDASIFLLLKLKLFSKINNFKLNLILQKIEEDNTVKLDFLHSLFYRKNFLLKFTKKTVSYSNLKNSKCIPEFTITECGEIKPDCRTYWPYKKFIFNINNLEEITEKKLICTVDKCSCLNFNYNSRYIK